MMNYGLRIRSNEQSAAEVHQREQSEHASLSVLSIDGIAAIERYASDIDRLNSASPRPNPFLSSAFLLCYALRSEYYVPGKEERLFLIREGNRLIGCAPMRWSDEEFGIAAALPRSASASLRFLAPVDSEHPGILSAPEDAARVANALIRHILDHEPACGMLEFHGQQPGTALYKAAHAAAGNRFRVRDIATEPYNDVSLRWASLAAYFQSLKQKMRSNISRQARKLYAKGETELIIADGAQAVEAWFDAYCELDARSWKAGTISSIHRHPRRVRFYRELVSGRGGLHPEFIGILLDGVLIAGMISGSNRCASPEYHGVWCLEMAYDQSRADLGPGQLLFLLAMGQAIENNCNHLSFMQNFAYYKHRWGAEPVEVVNVQLIRRASLHNARASLGDLKRALQQLRRGGASRTETVSDEAAPETKDSPTLPDLQRASVLAARGLAYTGPGVRRLDREQARKHLPFDIE